MKRTPLKSKSERQKAIDKALGVLRDVLKLGRGSRCQICGSQDRTLGLFHVLPRSTAPRLIFHSRNILLVCNYPCHNNWHHDYFKAQEIEKKIKELLGKNYKEELRIIEKCQPVMSMFQIESQYATLKKYLEILQGEGN